MVSISTQSKTIKNHFLLCSDQISKCCHLYNFILCLSYVPITCLEIEYVIQNVIKSGKMKKQKQQVDFESDVEFMLDLLARSMIKK